jgi:hypothetical protein
MGYWNIVKGVQYSNLPLFQRPGSTTLKSLLAGFPVAGRLDTFSFR